ncbi:MAG: hypothetical protein GY940_17030 [bacterium]|nr:hypothetical protein [bacterium]
MKKLSLIILMVFFAGLFLFPETYKTRFSPEKAKRVDQTLKRIAQKKKHNVFLRKISFSQEELNAYLNLIYVKRYTPEVKHIDLSLEKENGVSGTVKVVLKGKKYEKVPSFLRDIEVDLSGRVECQNYRMRVMLKKLKVNGASFSPELLDEAFGAAQSGFKVKKSMYDWFQLMPGIKNVTIEHKKITLFY